MQPSVRFIFVRGMISWGTIMGYCVYTFWWSVQFQLVELLLDFPMRFLMVDISVVMFFMVLLRLLLSAPWLATWVLYVSVASTKVWIAAVIYLSYTLFTSYTAASANPLTCAVACLMWQFSQCALDKFCLEYWVKLVSHGLRFYSMQASLYLLIWMFLLYRQLAASATYIPSSISSNNTLIGSVGL